MNNLIQNYEIILKTLQENCSHITSFKQIRQAKLSNLELSALDLTAEYMIQNSELQLFKVIENTYLKDTKTKSNEATTINAVENFLLTSKISVSA
jgi:hypothetical protein